MRAKSMLSILVFLLVLNITVIPASARGIQAVATFSVIADLVKQVGGDRVDVTSIVPFGGDPHSWEPTPREARNLAAADILFYNGLGLELWIDRLIASAARKDLPITVLSEGLEPREAQVYAGHSHQLGDPHFWLNVQYAMEYVKRIEESLVDLDPENAQYYKANSTRYLEELAALDAWLEQQIASIPEENRRIITYHDAFGYFAKRYGLVVSGFLVVNSDREPSAREMARLTEELGDYQRKVIFIEPQVGSSSRYGEAVAQEISGSIATLYTGSLTAEVPSYVEMMRFNGTSLVEALK